MELCPAICATKVLCTAIMKDVSRKPSVALKNKLLFVEAVKQTPSSLHCQKKYFVIAGFRWEVDQNCALLGCYAATDTCHPEDVADKVVPKLSVFC